jgi:GH35 family endo-1,4-beta-xylanase
MRQAAAAIALVVLFSGCAEAPKSAPEGTRALTDAEAIRRHRTGWLTIATEPGAEVAVDQLAHDFPFGACMSQDVMCQGRVSPEDKAKYLQLLDANFNAVVHENALKWYSTEREKGQITYDNAEAMTQWALDHGKFVRGHCVFWGVDRFVQDWIKELDDATLRAKAKERATGLLARFKGRIPEYDVNNEMLHGDFYARRLGELIRPQMFTWCHEADPDAVLYVNDFGILNSGETAAYEAQIEWLLANGAPVGGIGLQGHFFGDGADIEKVRRALDNLARFGLPIKITEYDLDNPDEDVRAESLARLYRTAFAHPAVDGILMWGFWEGAMWRPAAALWGKDWTPHKDALVYRHLVYDRWWTTFRGKADRDGICRVRVFFGKHRVRVEGVGERVVNITRDQGSGSVTILPAEND